MKNKEVKRPKLALLLGSKNISSFLNNFDRMLETGVFSEDLLLKIKVVLGIDDKIFYKALNTTLSEQKKIENDKKALEYEKIRNCFIPYIYVKVSQKRPDSILFAAISGMKWRYIYLPKDVFDLDPEFRLEKVKEIIRRNFIEQKGRCFLFGDITGYFYRDSLDNTIEFSTSGEVVNFNVTDFSESTCNVFHKNKEITIINKLKK